MTDNSEKLIRLAEKKFSQLTDADKKLFDAVARHEVANFKAKVDELNQPELAEQWGSERTLKSDRIVWLLTTPETSKLLSFWGLRISGAKIEGELNLEYAKVSVPLIFESCGFTKPLILQKSKLKELQLKGSYVSGIQAEEMRVEGSVFLSDDFKAEGEVNLAGASIGGQLDCTRGKFSNKDHTAINANAATIGASVYLRNGFKAEGEVNLLRASIGGQLSCTEGKFSNKGHTAIQADAAMIAADVYLRNDFKAEGEVNLRGASIGGQLDCTRGKFSNKDHTAIQADAATIAADVFLSDGFKAEGKVNLAGASIGGQLSCTGGKFSNKGQTAINANAATITASVLLRDGFKAEGEVNLLRASLGGNLQCTGGQFLNETRSALDAEGAKIGGSVFLGGKSNNSQFQAEGKIIFLNATIDDRFELELIESKNSASMLLDLRFAKVNTFSFKNRQAEESWIKQIKQRQLCLNGFVYSTINVSKAAIAMKEKNFFKSLWLQLKKDSDSDSDSQKNYDLLNWLQLQIEKGSDPQSENGFFLQPYEQLAAVLKANGHQEAATKVLIAKEDDRLCHGGLTFWGKVWNGILGKTIAYGYRPQQALLFSVVVMLVGWGVFFLNKELMCPTKVNPPWSSDDALNTFVYSIDTFTPVIDLYQQKMWLPDVSQGEKIELLFLKTTHGDLLRYYFWFQIIAGWVLTSLWVAGFTGLVRSKK